MLHLFNLHQVLHLMDHAPDRGGIILLNYVTQVTQSESTNGTLLTDIIADGTLDVLDL